MIALIVTFASLYLTFLFRPCSFHRWCSIQLPMRTNYTWEVNELRKKHSGSSVTFDCIETLKYFYFQRNRIFNRHRMAFSLEVCFFHSGFNVFRYSQTMRDRTPTRTCKINVVQNSDECCMMDHVRFLAKNKILRRNLQRLCKKPSDDITAKKPKKNCKNK